MRRRSERVYARPRPYPSPVGTQHEGYAVLDAMGRPLLSCGREERAYEYAGELADRKGDAATILCLETVCYAGRAQEYERELWRETVAPWVEVRLVPVVRTRTSALAECAAA